jgi:hypothetical protein
MEELKPEELEELVQELQEESEEEETLSPEVEQLLRDLPFRRFTARLRAARQLGGLGSSSRQIVQALTTLAEIDDSDEVRAVAAESLRAPVHQEYLQEYLERKKAIDIARQQRPAARRQIPETKRSAAAESTAQQQPSLLAPSELILLHGDKSGRTSSGALKLGGWVRVVTKNVRVVTKNTDAQARELGEKMLAAAFLAVEQAGAVQLEVRRQQALFGLLEVDRLYVVPGEGATSWPSRIFESQLCQIAVRLQSKSRNGHNHVSEIVYDWMGRSRGKSLFPWVGLGHRVINGLLSRGLLRRERKPGLKGLLAGASLVLPAETAAMATQQSVKPVVELLATCRRTRPEVWNLLIEGINKGIGKCEKQPDWD